MNGDIEVSVRLREHGHMIVNIGIAIAVVGFLVEVVAFAGIAFYPVRRALPFKSPIQLQSAGCGLFFVGVVIIVAGRLW